MDNNIKQRNSLIKENEFYINYNLLNYIQSYNGRFNTLCTILPQ